MSETFTRLFNGTLNGVMSEEDYEKLASSLEGSWNAVYFGEPGAAPEKLSGAEAGTLMLKLRDEVRARNMLSVTFPYTYVHTPRSPKMIKMYDPLKCGSGCSTSSPDPWVILSTVKPFSDELENLGAGKKDKRKKGLLSRILRR